MFMMESSQLNELNAKGLERFLIDFWLETIGKDTAAPYWPSMCSTLQTLKNLLSTILEVARQVVKEFHIPHSVEETLSQLDDCSWIKHTYAHDLTLVRPILEQLRTNHEATKKSAKEKSEESPEPDNLRLRNQQAVRATAGSILKAFLAKLERDNPIEQQIVNLQRLISDSATAFEVLHRAISELTNDLIHLGHSRDHLYGWMIRAIVKDSEFEDRLIDRFTQLATSLGKPIDGGCHVLFILNSNQDVPPTDDIQVHKALPPGYKLPTKSPFRTTKSQIAEVNVPVAFDRRSASDQAYRHLLRYLYSTRLDHLDFDRAIGGRSVVRLDVSRDIKELVLTKQWSRFRLHNDDEFYAMPASGRNPDTHAELDRVLYWLEQSHRWDDVGQLIALWTALEFLFARTSRSAAESIQDLLPSYLVPNFARETMIDFWQHLDYATGHVMPEPVTQHLEISIRDDGNVRMVGLDKLLALALQPQEGNPLDQLVEPYPQLVRKLARIRQFDPTPQIDMPIRRLLSRYERQIVFDIRYAFRARNTIVHDAAIHIVQIDRLIERMQWMLSTTLDTLLFQFIHNPTLSLSELHEINAQSFKQWKKRLADQAQTVPLADIVNPPRRCLSTAKS